MRSFKRFVVEGKKGKCEGVDLSKANDYSDDKDEKALEEGVDHTRYMRSHGKKASGVNSGWMFTTKEYGDVDFNDPKTFYQHSGRAGVADAAKAAEQHFKAQGNKFPRVFVLEGVEHMREEYKVGDKVYYTTPNSGNRKRSSVIRRVIKKDGQTKYELANAGIIYDQDIVEAKGTRKLKEGLNLPKTHNAVPNSVGVERENGKYYLYVAGKKKGEIPADAITNKEKFYAIVDKMVKDSK